jgi:glycosyltransferase involved in cell wall biosynthesis
VLLALNVCVDESAGKQLPQVRTLRVAIVAPTLHILGGHSVQAQRLLEGWEHDGEVDAWLVPINPEPRGRVARLLNIKYVRTVLTQLLYWPQLVRHLRRADVVHIFSASYASFLLAPLPAILVAKAFGRPVVLNYHSGEADDHLRRSRIARALIAKCEATIVPSRYLVDVFSGLGFDASAIPNVVDLKRFTYRRRHRLRPRILSVRNFERLYNVACTLRAFQLVQKRWPNAELTLVGSGSQESALRALASDLALDHVTFAGRVHPDQMGDYYASHDIYMQSPDIDNMPISVLDAYASGLPVVSTEAGGVPAILTHGEHGLLAPLDDHAALAARVLLLLEQPGLACELAERARVRCDDFQWLRVRDQWLSHYRQVQRPYEKQTTARLRIHPPARAE